MEKYFRTVMLAWTLGLVAALGACGGDAPSKDSDRRDGDASADQDGGQGDGGGDAASSNGGDGGADGSVPLSCGDGESDPEDDAEECDDGNRLSGDGCSGACKVEAGWLCPAEGGTCAANCGDGQLRGNEQCDDGNSQDGDGCGRSCKLEPGYYCPDAGQPCVAAGCGDGIVAGAEACDDANRVPGDGCGLDCQVEPGWVCVGALCSAAECGDRIVAGKEVCDDGNKAGGDGCLADCSGVEPLYVCPAQGGECGKAEGVVCGNAILTTDEECDDGNEIDGDGCTACEVDRGFVCPGGRGCSTTCGDGIKAGFEQCDDGGECVGGDAPGEPCASDAQCPGMDAVCEPVPDDGCDDTCNIEPGFKCDQEGEPCTEAVCGNGEVEGIEQCDDGDSEIGDGCTPLCTREPTCADGECDAVCGDGVLHVDEECDDGNRQSFDGCSQACEVEDGFSCAPLANDPPPCVELPVVLRDFKAHNDSSGTFQHEDMRAGNGPDGGDDDDLVLFELGWDLDHDGVLDDPGTVPAGTPKGPVYDVGSNGTDGGNTDTTHGPEWFYSWYSDTDYGQTVVQTLVLCDDIDDLPYVNTVMYGAAPVDGDGVYTFADTTFYPLDGLGWQDLSRLDDPADVEQSFTDGSKNGCGINNDEVLDPDAGKSHNFMFTSEVRFWFTYQEAADQELTFTGDDDVFVFVNGYKVVDLGGIHCAQSETVALNDVAVAANLVDGGVYEAVVYQAERNPTMSTYRLDLGQFLSSKSECASFCGDGVRTSDEICDDGSLCEGGDMDGAPCLEGGDCPGGACVSQNDGSYGQCNPDCQGRGSYCGDGVLDDLDGEQCDLGAAQNDGRYEGCRPNCTFGPVCGDGNTDGPHEQCDDGDENVDGVYGKCGTDCHFGPRCGDEVVQKDQGEQCDNGPSPDPFEGCTPDCKLLCGDGVVQMAFGEECDDGTADNDGSYGGCKVDCTRAAYCGDGNVQAGKGEECDDGNANSFDGCSATCKNELVLQ